MDVFRHSAAKLRRDAGESVEGVSRFLDYSSLAVTTTYLRRLEGVEDQGWAKVAEALGGCKARPYAESGVDSTGIIESRDLGCPTRSAPACVGVGPQGSEVATGFVRTVRDSIYSPSFYATVPRRSFGTALGYFLLLSLILALVKTVSTGITLVTALTPMIERAVRSMAEAYPADLEIRLRGGRASTNVREPYFLRVADSDRNLLVIDTRTAPTLEQYRAYNTMFWLTRDSVIGQGERASRIQIIELSQLPDLDLSRPWVMSLSDAATPWVRAIGPTLVVLSLPLFYLLYGLRLLYLLLVAPLIWVVARWAGRPLSYGQSYKVGLYGITLGLLVDVGIHVTRGWLGFGGFPFMFTLITLAVVVANVALRKTEGETTSVEGS